MENNIPEFDINKYNDFIKSIKAGSPVHKINFTLESPNAVVGMYLITMDDAEAYLDKAADKTDLNDDTLLVFESRHVIECCQIIYGCLNILSGIGMYKISYNTFIEQVVDTLLSKPQFYTQAIKELVNIAHNLIHIEASDDNMKKIYVRFLYIMRNIWFVPYGQIDEMAKEGIAEFEKHCKDGENNE